ncbi:MAG TPA: cellulose biosynthesis protein BcsS, partial [Novosphingobium sp.]|nr:cellulose biosynthesis protein BcsS [Novosphingobium sp.]
DLALVEQVSGGWGWANVSAGPRYTHTRLSPVDPGNSRRGSRWDLGLQTDGALDSPGWRLSWLGSYGVVDEEYQAQLELGRKIGSKGLRLGIEGGVQGDPSYRKVRGGAFIAAALGTIEVQVGGGVSKERGQSSCGYASISLAKVF